MNGNQPAFPPLWPSPAHSCSSSTQHPGTPATGETCLLKEIQKHPKTDQLKHRKYRKWPWLANTWNWEDHSFKRFKSFSPVCVSRRAFCSLKKWQLYFEHLKIYAGLNLLGPSQSSAKTRQVQTKHFAAFEARSSIT